MVFDGQHIKPDGKIGFLATKVFKRKQPFA